MRSDEIPSGDLSAVWGEGPDGRPTKKPWTFDADVAATVSARIVAVQAAENAVAATLQVASASWTALSARAVDYLGQRAAVYGDAGDHVDPVSSATVANTGIYAGTASGWQWVAPAGTDLTPASDAEVSAGTGLGYVASGQLPLLAATLEEQIAGDSATKWSSPATVKGLLALAVARLGRRPATYRERTTGSSFLWAIKEKGGRVLAGLRHNLRWVVRDIELLKSSSYRSTGGLPLAIKDASGKIALSIDGAGRVFLRLGSSALVALRDDFAQAALAWSVTQLRFLEGTVRHRSTGGFAYSVVDEDGKVAFGVDAAGKVEVRLNSKALAHLAADLAISATPVFRGSGDVINVRGTAGLVTATLREGGWAGDVAQLPSGVDTAVVVDPAPMVGLFFYGQSNAGSGGNGVPALLTALYPRHVLTFNGGNAGIAQYGDTAVTAGNLTDAVPARNYSSATPPWPGVYSGFALEAHARAGGRSTGGVFVRHDWWGSQALTTFVQGGTPYANLLASIAKAKEVMARYGRGVWPLIVWVQGEGGPLDRAAYSAGLADLVEDLRGDLKALYGAAPPFLFFQINAQDTDTESDRKPVVLAQLDVAKAYLNTPVALVGPMYQMPLADMIHCSEEGRMIFGETLAEAVRAIQARGWWTPLMPKAVSRSGAVITIDFHNPGLPLKWDTDWVLAAPNFGFSYADDTSSASVASVAITGDAQVQVTLTATPTGGNKKIAYANSRADTLDDQWSARRGQLYAPSGRRSAFAALGNAIPADIRHYCVRFEEIVP